MNVINPYIRLRPPPETPLDEICTHESTTPIKLMSALGENPLHCVICNLEIKPESLNLSVGLINRIAGWRDVYNAIDHLWLDSREYEAWALDQLINMSSPVNQHGLTLRSDLNSIRRCYYWYFQDQSADGFQPVTNCPNCQAPLTLFKAGIFMQLICEQCSIITVGE